MTKRLKFLGHSNGPGRPGVSRVVPKNRLPVEELSSICDKSVTIYKFPFHSSRSLPLRNYYLHQEYHNNTSFSLCSLLKIITYRSTNTLVSSISSTRSRCKLSRSTTPHVFSTRISSPHTSTPANMKTHNSVALEVDDLHRTYYDEKVRLQAPCLTVEQMEARVKSTINGLREIRGTMTIMARQHDDYSYELAEMVIVARKATQEAMFKVRRYHDVKEEAIRVKHRRELAALGQERNGLLTYCAKRMKLVVRHNVESRMANNASCCDKKLEQLQDALDKVEMHEFLLSSDVGDSCW